MHSLTTRYMMQCLRYRTPLLRDIGLSMYLSAFHTRLKYDPKHDSYWYKPIHIYQSIRNKYKRQYISN